MGLRGKFIVGYSTLVLLLVLSSLNSGRSLWLVTFTAVAAGVIFYLYISLRILKPLHIIIETIQQMAAGNLGKENRT